MIYTGSHDNCLRGNLIAISGNRGKNVNYIGRSYPKLAPKLNFWTIWHSNIGIISEKENNEYYIKEYYSQVLKDLDPNLVIEELGDNPILLCYENNYEFCHRHLVAEWLNITLSIEVFEVAIDINGNITYLKRPNYIKEILIKHIEENKRRVYIKSNKNI